jgi:predicted nucleic acid-binding protein
MKGDRCFLDSNVLIYAVATEDPRAEIAEGLIAAGGLVSVQTLNEFVSVAVRKLRMPWDDVLEALAAFRIVLLPPAPITIEIHNDALHIAARYRYHIYDSLIIAAAIRAKCRTLYSEDMRDGQIIDGLTIRNPFTAAPPTTPPQ